jgi:GTP-binding protein
MFVDVAKIQVQAGDGGNGAVSFRHEKFIDRGGPDGGDGGNGADVIMRASRNQDTLASFRYQKLIKADSGTPGAKRKRHGKTGPNLVLEVPIGTVMTRLDTQEIIADLTDDGQEAVIAKGGKGGFGNAHFVSSVRQAPRVAEKGEKGEKLEVILELKMIADVGLVGLPNAGKSTLLATVSNAKPEIANYPFTTLTPNLGVVDVDKSHSLLMADIPGLIEGASQGKGLGDEFLRHVERTSVMIHLIDAYTDNVVEAYNTIQKELADYATDLSKRPQVVALSKVDGLDQQIIDDQLAQLKKVVPKTTKLFAFSSKDKTGMSELLFEVGKLVQKQKAKSQKKAEKENNALPTIRLTNQEDSWQLQQVGKQWVVTGVKIERFAKRTDFSNPHGVQRLRDIVRKMGIIHELERKQIDPGQKIVIGDPAIGELEY